MGQYWYVVNLTKKEFITPHRLGAGFKLWEQLASHPGTGAALTVLCAAMPEPRGGGDFDTDENWRGPERQPDAIRGHNMNPGPMPVSYPTIAKRTIGRWAGDRIALVGDYARDSDLPPGDYASEIHDQCSSGKGGWVDVSADVAAVIEHELGGCFVGKADSWRTWQSSRIP